MVLKVVSGVVEDVSAVLEVSEEAKMVLAEAEKDSGEVE